MREHHEIEAVWLGIRERIRRRYQKLKNADGPEVENLIVENSIDLGKMHTLAWVLQYKDKLP